MTGLELINLAWLTIMGVMVLSFLAWLIIEEDHETIEQHRHKEHKAHKLAIKAEQARIQRDLQEASQQLQQQAWAVQRQMVQRVLEELWHRS